MSYLDSSAIVKLIIREAETDAVETHIVSREALVSSRLSEAETLRAVRRVEQTRAVEHVRDALEAVFLHDVDANVIRRAGLLDPPEVRTADAIHLATALAIGDPELQFVTYDNRLARAATAAGLQVVQPGRDVHRAATFTVSAARSLRAERDQERSEAPTTSRPKR